MFGKPKLVGIEKLACTGWARDKEFSPIKLSAEQVEVIVRAYSNGRTTVICPYATKNFGSGNSQYCSCATKSTSQSREQRSVHLIDNHCFYND